MSAAYFWYISSLLEPGKHKVADPFFLMRWLSEIKTQFLLSLTLGIKIFPASCNVLYSLSLSLSHFVYNIYNSSFSVLQLNVVMHKTNRSHTFIHIYKHVGIQTYTRIHMQTHVLSLSQAGINLNTITPYKHKSHLSSWSCPAWEEWRSPWQWSYPLPWPWSLWSAHPCGREWALEAYWCRARAPPIWSLDLCLLLTAEVQWKRKNGIRDTGSSTRHIHEFTSATTQNTLMTRRTPSWDGSGQEINVSRDIYHLQMKSVNNTFMSKSLNEHHRMQERVSYYALLPPLATRHGHQRWAGQHRLLPRSN